MYMENKITKLLGLTACLALSANLGAAATGGTEVALVPATAVAITAPVAVAGTTGTEGQAVPIVNEVVTTGATAVVQPAPSPVKRVDTGKAVETWIPAVAQVQEVSVQVQRAG